VLGSIRGCLEFIMCQKRLRLSWKVDECEPLPTTRPKASTPAACHVGLKGRKLK